MALGQHCSATEGLLQQASEHKSEANWSQNRDTTKPYSRMGYYIHDRLNIYPTTSTTLGVKFHTLFQGRTCVCVLGTSGGAAESTGVVVLNHKARCNSLGGGAAPVLLSESKTLGFLEQTVRSSLGSTCVCVLGIAGGRS